jgi:ABC-2 type transport system permease protein
MTTPPNTSTIHDIGYRRYEGPRLGTGYIARSLYVSTLRGAFGLGRSMKSKVFPAILLVLMVAPALIISAASLVTGDDSLPVEYTSYAMNLSAVTMVFLGSQSPVAVSRDLRFRLVSLYFARPISRQAYVQSKLAAMVTAVFLLMGAPLVVLYAASLLGGMSVWDNARGFGQGMLGAAMFATVLAPLALLIASWTPRRGIGVVAIVIVLSVLASVSATVQGVAQDQGNDTVAGWGGLISPFSLVDGIQVWLFNVDDSLVAGPPESVGGPVFALVAVALVGLCYLLLLRRYRGVTR